MSDIRIPQNPGVGGLQEFTSAERQYLQNLAATNNFSSDITVPDEAYGGSWNGSTEVPTKNAVYDQIQSLVLSGGTGTVTTVSVVTANGFAGTVATATTTPAITLTTSITGILKGNGTAISAAIAGTDYTTPSSTESFTNKTFNADGTGNSITNIENADIKAAAGIVLTKLAATTVSRALVSDSSGFIVAATTTDTEIGYLNGVTSAIQTQINTKTTGAASATDNAITRMDGTTGKIIQNSLVTIDDSGSITIPQGQFIKSGANTIFGGNGFNTLFRPDSSGGEIQIQNFAGATKTTFYDSGMVTFSADITIPDEAYGSGWNGSLEAPTKNALWDKIETIVAGDPGTSYTPLVYAYLPDYKLQTEIDTLIAGDIATNGKFWAVFWENFRFETDGDYIFVDTSVSGGSAMGYSSANRTRALNVADNLVCGVAGDLDSGVATMMANSTKRNAAIAAIVAHVSDNGFIGVNINFEPIPSLAGTVLANFRIFIAALRVALDAIDTHYIITWAGQIAWDSDIPNKEFSSVNYTGESNMAGTNNLSFTINDLNDIGFDIMEMQAYDQFYDFGFQEFGITSPDQVVCAINYAQARIDKSKHAIIIGAYGVRMNSGADVYGNGLENNNMTRAEVTALDATFYSTATRLNNQYLQKTIDTSIGAATMTIASPGVISRTAHGLSIGETISFTTTGALPTGVVAGTTYYVITAGFTANAFRISATSGGTAINTTGTQSGVHTLYRRTSIQAAGQSTVDTYYAICKNKEVAYIGFWLAGDYYYPSVR